jgi:hypothetical protein
MVKKLSLSTALAVATLGVGAITQSAQAASVINNTGISNPDQVITFSEFSFPTGTAITDQFSSLGASFSPQLFYNVNPSFFPTESLASFSNTGNNVSILFNTNVTAAAFALQSNPEPTTFTALKDGMVVEFFTTNTNLSFLPDLTNASNFYGFENIEFNELRIENSSQIFQIDNLQFSNAITASVPEPSTIVALAMVGSGLLLSKRVKRG